MKHSICFILTNFAPEKAKADLSRNLNNINKILN